MLDLEKIQCSGCGACANICPTRAIEMRSDSEGFSYPVIDRDACIGCRKCEHTCPQLNRRAHREDREPGTWAVRAVSEETRLGSASGGVFMVLARAVLRQGGVVFGAAFDEAFGLRHLAVEREEDLPRLAGSKYLQSEIGRSYSSVRDYLKQGRTVLFSGTPCQVAGLKAFLGHEEGKLICVDFICHGVPSPKYWKQYVQYRSDCACSRPVQISFRDKCSGWREFSMCFRFENGTQYRASHKEDPYMQLFLQDLSLRPSCYHCSYKTASRISDLTLADFWGVRKACPEMDDDTGVSLILVQSDGGKALLEQVRQELEGREIPFSAVLKGNRSVIQSAKCPQNRSLFFETAARLSPREAADRFARPTGTQKLLAFVKKTVKTLLLQRR